MSGFLSKAATFGQRTIALGLSSLSIGLLVLSFRGAYIMRQNRLERVRLMQLDENSSEKVKVRIENCGS